MKQLVKIIIPFYKEELKDWENAALTNNIKKLAGYPIVFLAPEGLNIERYTQTYPQVEIIRVSTNWLGTQRGIAGYNEMMMSEAFYQLFADSEYILICHTDAWIFSDQLQQWCQKGYDLIAAPWPTRPRYKHFPMNNSFNSRNGYSLHPTRFHACKCMTRLGTEDYAYVKCLHSVKHVANMQKKSSISTASQTLCTMRIFSGH